MFWPFFANPYISVVLREAFSMSHSLQITYVQLDMERLAKALINSKFDQTTHSSHYIHQYTIVLIQEIYRTHSLSESRHYWLDLNIQ